MRLGQQCYSAAKPNNIHSVVLLNNSQHQQLQLMEAAGTLNCCVAQPVSVGWTVDSLNIVVAVSSKHYLLLMQYYVL